MNREQALQKEIEESRAWLGSENDDTIYKHYRKKSKNQKHGLIQKMMTLYTEEILRKELNL